MRAHKHLQAHIHQRVSLSIFPLTCKMKGKYQIDTTTNYALPSDPASCWEGKQTGGVVLRHHHHHHHQVDREWSCVIWLLRKRLRSQQGSWSVWRSPCATISSERNSEVQRRAAEFRGTDYKVWKHAKKLLLSDRVLQLWAYAWRISERKSNAHMLAHFFTP